MNRKRRDNSGLIIFTSIASAVILSAIIVCVFLLAKLDSENPPTSTEAPQTTVTTTSADTTTSATTVTTTAESSTTTTTEATTTETTPETTTETSPDTETEAPAAEETTAPAETETVVTASVPTYGKYDRSHFENDLFIGDSIYTGLYLYEYFPENQVFAKVGLNPMSARTSEINGTTVRARAKAMQPAHIFIMLGSNGIAGTDASYMANSIKSLVTDLHEVSPDSSIYIVSIPPVTYAHELKGQETLDKIKTYNALLESAASECEAKFLDLYDELTDDSGYFAADYAEADGLHFLGAAYVRMLSFFDHEMQ